LRNVFAKYTGGRRVSFLKQKGLEQVVEDLGVPSETATFHQVRVEVRNRPELVVRTRAGYWPVSQ
jgi:hypothetical protein